MICPFFAEREFFRGSDSGFYYAKQIGEWSEMWWVGEHPRSNWVNVFQGSLSIGDDNECRWEGRFFDVPKGHVCNSGPLELGGTALASGASVLTRETVDTPFGGRLWNTGFTREFADLGAERLCPGFEGEGLENLSGAWEGDDLGSYYVYQVKDTNEFVWFAEHPGAEPDEPGAAGGRQWASVFIGERDGGSISGRWSDVPKGEIDQFGELDLVVEDEETIRIVRQTGGYGGRVLRRLPTENRMEVRLQINSLQILDRQEKKGGGDEPLVEFAIAKMDGDAIDLSDLGASQAIFSGGFINDLGENLPAGRTVDLSGQIETQVVEMTRVPDATPEQESTVLGIAIACWEQDRGGPTVGDTREDQWMSWMSLLEYYVTRDLQRTGIVPDFHRHAGLRLYRFRWRNQDDLVGHDTGLFSWQDLLEIAGVGSKSIDFDCIGSGAHYQVNATIEVSACNRANPRCP